GGSEDVPPVERTLTRRSRPVEAAERFLGLGIRKTLKRLRGAGWPVVELHWSLVKVSDEFYAADSAKKPGEEAPAHRKGELKKPAHEERHWWLRAEYAACRLALIAEWTEGLTPAGKRSFTFQSATVFDPVGEVVELRADYSVDANAKRRVKDEPGHIYEGRIALLEANARRLDREYNDNTAWHRRGSRLVKSTKDFEAWLSDAEWIIEKAAELEAAA
ncbi:MAG: hypothetical protein K0S65_2072, partial [Labilithrix sp.]|nr:hypothetical protein [Labilithrix sp.]